jgi:hypothetical protein
VGAYALKKELHVMRRWICWSGRRVHVLLVARPRAYTAATTQRQQQQMAEALLRPWNGAALTAAAHPAPA